MEGDASDPFAKFKSGYIGLSKDEIKEDLDTRYSTGDAYPNTAKWIHSHHRDLELTISDMIKDITADSNIVEVGCGSGGVAAHHVRNARSIFGTDLSDTALNIAREFFRDRPEVSYIQSDAEGLPFSSDRFDVAVAKEVLEHVPNVRAAIWEINRVLKKGGLFVLSTPNRDSLHLRINRKLGHQDFMCAGDHFKEYSFSEMCEILSECGFVIEEARGVTLLPYHYVTDVFPEPIRHLEDHDDEFVELMSELGKRCGPEYAFCYVIAASKHNEKFIRAEESA